MMVEKAVPENRILLADADAFYVAVARLVDPEGAGAAPLLVVGGSADRRGVVTSASYQTRAYGVRSGMPMAQALRLCPDATRVSVPGRACRDKSREIREVLERFTPVVEPASIDEFYLDLSGTAALYGGESLAGTATRIRQDVHAETALHVSIGGGTSKLIAKLAAKQAKPHRGNRLGVEIVAPGREAAFVAGLALADIPGIGPRIQDRLAQRGLTRVHDALTLSQDALEEWLGPRTGRWVFRRIRGLDDGRVVGRPQAKSHSREETFPRDIDTDEQLERELLKLTTRVAADLRSHGERARTITVKLRDADFTTRQSSRTLPEPVSSDRPMYAVSRQLLRRLRRARRTGARLLGVAASHLSSDAAVTPQMELFDFLAVAEDTSRDRQLVRALDEINRRFGRDRIARASTVHPADDAMWP
jgi:DNA polymerase-4